MNATDVPHVVLSLKADILSRLPKSYAWWYPSVLSALLQHADSSRVWHPLAHWLLMDSAYGLVHLCNSTPEMRCIERVAALVKDGATDVTLYREADAALHDKIPYMEGATRSAFRAASAICAATLHADCAAPDADLARVEATVRSVVLLWIAANSGGRRGFWVTEEVAVDALAKKFLEVLSERS